MCVAGYIDEMRLCKPKTFNSNRTTALWGGNCKLQCKCSIKTELVHEQLCMSERDSWVPSRSERVRGEEWAVARASGAITAGQDSRTMHKWRIAQRAEWNLLLVPFTFSSSFRVHSRQNNGIRCERAPNIWHNNSLLGPGNLCSSRNKKKYQIYYALNHCDCLRVLRTLTYLRRGSWP